MKIAIYLMTFAFALQAPAASAQALWGGAAYGMDVAQVQAWMPQARVPDEPDELAGGESEGLRVEGVELAGHRFQASYFFAGGALVQVDLVQEAPRAETGVRVHFPARTGSENGVRVHFYLTLQRKQGQVH